MRIFFLVAIVLVASSTMAGAQDSMAEGGEGKLRYIVKFKEPASSEAEIFLRSNGAGIIHRLGLIDSYAIFGSPAIIDLLGRNENVERIEPDAKIFATQSVQITPWGIERVNASTVWNYSKGAGVNVSIIDSGIDYGHPDLWENFVGGHDFVNNDSDPYDDDGHGTHVAGIVAAVDNDFGVVGAAPEARLYVVKALDENGEGYTSDLVAGIEWSVERNVQVISMSLGSNFDSQSLHEAVDSAYNSGIVLVAAAGNDGNPGGGGDKVDYPARYDSVIAVGATDSNYLRGSFSSTGPSLELSAPGVNINSTYPNSSYSLFSGTSMATPHVTGVVALLLESEPGLTPDQVRTRLQDAALDLGAPGRDDLYGYGLVDAWGSLNITPDVQGPALEFVPPTPENGSTLNQDWAYINVSVDEALNTALLEWNDVNETMDQGSWHKNKTGLVDGLYRFRVWANDSAGNWNVTAKRTLTIDLPKPVHNLATGINYSTIQAAIDAADENDTITVDPGTYNENIDLNKSINLVGAGAGVTIINSSNSSDHVIEITSNGVNLSEFTLIGPWSGDLPVGGLYLNNSNRTKIENVTVSKIRLGIYLDSFNHFNSLINCNVTNTYIGLYLQSSNSNNSIIKSTVNNNAAGIYLNNSNFNTFSNNTLDSNLNWGIFLRNSKGNNLLENSFINNSARGYWGVTLNISSNNTIFHNNFINNTNQAQDDGGNTWDNGYPEGGNYWSDFDTPGEGCVDANNNSICDAPYNISGGGNQDRYPVTSINGWENINTPPAINALNPVPAEPQPAGTNVTWACRGNDTEGDLLRYMFRMRGPSTGNDWLTVRGFDDIGNWTWTTSMDDVGETDVKCVFKDSGGLKSQKTYYNYEIWEVSDATHISSCTSISSPGFYVLVNDIMNSSDEKCIDIKSSDVSFDGGGHTIDGLDTFFTIGVYVYNSTTNLKNVTVKNLVLTDWGSGIYYDRAQNGSITNNTASSNAHGIRLYSSNNNFISNNTANSNVYSGIWLDNFTNNNTLTSNTVNSNRDGIYISPSCNNNVISGNTLSSNTRYGVYISSNNSKFYNNYFNNTNNAAITVTTTTIWNTSKILESNIIGGQYLGGNFWAKPNGKGFSVTCSDSDSDGICDSSFAMAPGNVDYLPLRVKTPPTVDVLKPVPAEPQPAGTNVTWSCQASDPEGDLLRYMFRMRGPSTGDTWVTVRGFRVGRKWKWQTKQADMGETDVKCVVKDYPAHNKASKTYYNYEITS
jgi:parallel beta-helix repeat protein